MTHLLNMAALIFKYAPKTHTNHTFISTEMCSKNSTHAIAHQFFMRWKKKKKKEQDSATQICNYWVIHWPSFKGCRTARIQYHALRSVLEYRLKVLNRPNLANPLETPHLPASYTGSASIIQQRQQWRAAETLTFLSRFHSLRQQKLQKNKSPTMSADTGVPPRCSSSFHRGRRIPHCHNKPLAAAEPADGKGREERGSSSSLRGWAHLWNKCHSSRLHPQPPPPFLSSPHFCYDLIFLFGPAPSCLARRPTGCFSNTHPSSPHTKFLPILWCCSHASITFVGQE